ncbi:hypothetical protein OUZ56_019808 [Daphnia magna]|uniref:Uncharacterized protein n=1 Tax=Daphnia magna TaxID=35525 RepID=A0ABQ9ZCP3_9CRUS|nr:hypothetical protein OUZ56_019808 [Daphnia magna]
MRFCFWNNLRPGFYTTTKYSSVFTSVISKVRTFMRGSNHDAFSAFYFRGLHNPTTPDWFHRNLKLYVVGSSPIKSD